VHLAAAVGLTAVPLAAAAAADDDGPPIIVQGELGRELDELLAACAEWGFSGSVVASRDDQVVLRNGYGLADRGRGVPNSPDTLFEIASVAKHFTAVAILHLEEAGRLSTNDPIRRWLPEVPEEHAAVTIEHLLAHTSGFPRMGPAGGGDDMVIALRDYVSGGRVREPGADFEYWNGGYAMLAMIIERASGVPFEIYTHQHLFTPAGMTSTGFCREGSLDADRLAHGYAEDLDVGSAAAHSFGWEYRGMGGIVTSVTDLDRWDRALRAGRILRSTAKLQKPSRWGYAGGGWIERTARGTPLIAMGGNVAGFNAAVWRMPEDPAFVAVLCNTPAHTFVVAQHLYRRLFDRPGSLAVPPEVADLDGAAIAAMCGSFRSADGSALHLHPDDGAVRVAAEGQPAVQMLMSGDPAPPAHIQGSIDRARWILQGIVADDYEPFRAAMADGIPEDWPRRFRAGWQSQIELAGDVESVELIGAKPTAMSPSSLKALFRLQHERGTSLLEILLDGGRMVICTPQTQLPLIEMRYVPTSPASLESHVIGPGARPSIAFNAELGTLELRGPGGATLEFEKVVAANDHGKAPGTDRVEALREAAVAIASTDPADIRFADLEPLAGLVGDAGVVSLGEMTHGDGSAFLLRTRLVRYLHERLGFDVLAFESGLIECERVMEALRGDGPIGEAIELGIYDVWARSAEMRPLFEYVRATQTTGRPLRLVGFDPQLSSPRAVGYLKDGLQDAAGPAPWLDAMLAAVADPAVEISEPQLDDWSGRLDGLQRTIARSGRDDAALWVQAVDSLRWQLRARRHGSSAPPIDFRDPDASLLAAERIRQTNARDRGMAENLLWHLREQFPRRKIIVWAANNHVRTSSARESSGAEPVRERRMGQVLKDALGDELYTVVASCYEGAWAAAAIRSPDGSVKWREGRHPRAEAGTLAALLHESGLRAAWLDLEAAGASCRWLADPTTLRGDFHPGPPHRLAEYCDAVLFLDVIEPATPARDDGN
jgi:CubicO group peptidase (beta-lactamase class C family)/erythromycin esterase-like protein